MGVGSGLVNSDQVPDLAKSLVADAANEHQALRPAEWAVLVSVSDDLGGKAFADAGNALEFVRPSRVYIDRIVRRCGRCGLEFVHRSNSFMALRTTRGEHRDKQQCDFPRGSITSAFRS